MKKNKVFPLSIISLFSGVFLILIYQFVLLPSSDDFDAVNTGDSLVNIKKCFGDPDDVIYLDGIKKHHFAIVYKADVVDYGKYVFVFKGDKLISKYYDD